MDEPDVTEVRAAPPASRHILRCRQEHVAAAGGCFGVPIPTIPCRAAAAGPRAALWLGPDEWLLIAETGAEIAPQLAPLAENFAFSLVDIGHRHVAFEIAGAAARDVLAFGCPLALDDAAFPPGACTRTVFGKCEIVLWRVAPALYRVEVARSFAPYLRELLHVARANLATA
jgi:sarcosine oxidase subunit gamma